MIVEFKKNNNLNNKSLKLETDLQFLQLLEITKINEIRSINIEQIREKSKIKFQEFFRCNNEHGQLLFNWNLYLQ